MISFTILEVASNRFVNSIRNQNSAIFLFKFSLVYSIIVFTELYAKKEGALDLSNAQSDGGRKQGMGLFRDLNLQSVTGTSLNTPSKLTLRKISRYGSALFPDGPWKSATRFSRISRNVH
jgi:hypothetical protein